MSQARDQARAQYRKKRNRQTKTSMAETPEDFNIEIREVNLDAEGQDNVQLDSSKELNKIDERAKARKKMEEATIIPEKQRQSNWNAEEYADKKFANIENNTSKFFNGQNPTVTYNPEQVINTSDAAFENQSLAYMERKNKPIQQESKLRAKGETLVNNSQPTPNSIIKSPDDVVDDVVDAAKKKGGKSLDDINWGKMGRIGAAVGIGAIIVSNMNKNKGQQSNGQLYGQQTPYM